MIRPSILFAAMLALLLAGTVPAAAEDPPVPPLISCGNGVAGGINCIPTKHDLKLARAAFDRGVKLNKHERLEEALAQFEEASRLAPQDMHFLTAREMVKAKLVFDHIEAGNKFLATDARLRAAAEFQAAVNLDPDNSFAQERLAEATRQTEPRPVRHPVALAEESEPIQLMPSDERATFHFEGDIKELFTQLAAAYKMSVQIDDSLAAHAVRFNVDKVDFLTALRLACEVSKGMWVALGPKQVLILKDNPENHKQYDRVMLGTFALPPHSSPQEATELMTAVKSVLEVQKIQLGQTADTLEVRAPAATVEAVGRLIDQLQQPRPEVMLNLRVFQISHMLTRNMGLHAPNTFTLYNIPAVALAGLGGQSISSLINQLISSGGINQAGSSSLSGLLSQLEGQANSIFSQPLATFGGGLTFMGLSLDQLAAQLSLNESWSRELDDVQIRASQGTEATFHLGEKYPIMNASYAPIYNSSAISKVLGNQSYVAPVPSVNYEDIGLSLKAKPIIEGDGSVSLQLELQVRSLTGQSTNGIPEISNKEYKGSIRLVDGEPAFLAGQISTSDTVSMSGLPVLSGIPGLNLLTSVHTKEEEDDELMISITPHILSNFERSTPEIWLSQQSGR
jgi:tetratricopeptide (TPR) repeat protein